MPSTSNLPAFPIEGKSAKVLMMTYAIAVILVTYLWSGLLSKSSSDNSLVFSVAVAITVNL